MLMLACCEFNVYGQDQIKRPPRQQLHTKKTSKKVSVSVPDGYINGYGYVDLGLPSGTKWAVCNVGATAYYQSGNFFYWGNSVPFGKSTEELKAAAIIDENGFLLSSLDNASKKWGANWRMPSKKECDELISTCKWSIRTFNRTRGYLVKGPNGKSIFLPFAGWRRENGEICDVGDEAEYLTNSYNMASTVGNCYDTIHVMGVSIWIGSEYRINLVQRNTVLRLIRAVLD